MTKQDAVDFEVGTILRMVNMVNERNILPHAGGFLDQNALFVHFYYYVTQVQATRKELDDRQAEAKNRVSRARR